MMGDLPIYQCIEAYSVSELEERIANCIALGYMPIGGVNAKMTRHNIKGDATVLRQSMWLSDRDSDSNLDHVATQLDLLKQVSQTSVHPDGAPEEAVIDSELVEAINEYLDGV